MAKADFSRLPQTLNLTNKVTAESIKGDKATAKSFVCDIWIIPSSDPTEPVYEVRTDSKAGGVCADSKN